MYTNYLTNTITITIQLIAVSKTKPAGNTMYYALFIMYYVLCMYIRNILYIYMACTI